MVAIPACVVVRRTVALFEPSTGTVITLSVSVGTVDGLSNVPMVVAKTTLAIGAGALTLISSVWGNCMAVGFGLSVTIEKAQEAVVHIRCWSM